MKATFDKPFGNRPPLWPNKMLFGENYQSTRHPLVALFLTWAIMGFWHGASWTFVIWGLYHASLIAIYRMIAVPVSGLPSWIKTYGGWGITLLLVMLGCIPFRAKSVDDSFSMFAKLISPGDYLWLGMRENTYYVTTVLLIFVF